MKYTFLAVLLLTLGGCGKEDAPDAYGNFEADAVTVSNDIGGQLLRFDVEAGDHLSTGLVAERRTASPSLEGTSSIRPGIVGLVDTARLALQRRELLARRRATRSRTVEISAQVDVLEAQLKAARRELERTRFLYEGEATTEQRLDRAADEVRVLQQRIEAERARRAGLAGEVDAVSAQIAQIDERIQKSWIINPTEGTVLVTYAEPGEFIRAGQSLYRIAALDTMVLRAYVSGAQLADVRLGEHVRVFIDESEDERRGLPGRVTWIAGEAEFTPTPIQTREERVDLVYAVEIRVPNPNGIIKIGMPAEVMFGKGGMGERESGGK